MAVTGEPENLPDHLTRRGTPNGWRVISNPSRQPNLKADALKTLLQTMRKRYQRTPGKRKLEETDPPEAA
jgi:hypothetical protein